MLNTNLPKIEPREKLLLERRHSICLEISKKRRQSVATSIFIPKDSRKTISKSNSSQKPTSRNKKFLTSVINRKRKFGRIFAKKKLKRLTISNIKKIVTKNQSSLSSLKHPESYPIVRQSVSSQRIRCVAESLRDKKMPENAIATETSSSINNTSTEACQSNFSTGLYAAEALEAEQNPTQNIQIKQRKEKECSSHGACTNDQSERINNSPRNYEMSHNTHMHSNLESEISTVHDELSKPQTHFRSIKKIDNFLIMVDSSGSNVEIKYDGTPLSHSTEIVTLHDFSGTDEYTPKHSNSIENIKKEFTDFVCSKTKNCTTTINTSNLSSQPAYVFSSSKLANRIEACSDKSGNTADDTLKSNFKQSIQDIVDLSIRETTGSTINQPTKLSYRTAASKFQTVHTRSTCPLPTHETRIPCHPKHVGTNSFSTSNFLSCCSNYETPIPPKVGAQLHQTHTFNPHPLQSRPSFIQQMPYFETPPISPREHQYATMPRRMNFPMHELHHNESIHQTQQPTIDSSANVITNGANYPSYSNGIYRLDQHATQTLYRPDDVRHRQLFELYNSCTQQHLRQVPESHQTNLQQHCRLLHPQVQYHHEQPIQTNYAYQHHQTCNYHNIDLPRQFYHPLHQNLFPYTATPAEPTSTNGSHIYGTWRMHNNPVPPHGFNRSMQGFLPPKPPITDRNLPIEHLIPINFPFPPSNWSNTLHNSSVSPLKAPSHLNLSAHTYPMHKGYRSDTELVSHLNINAPRASTSTSLATDRTPRSHWQAPHPFSINYM
ncbi:uncharacterized protein [Eurosta solidaginis]